MTKAIKQTRQNGKDTNNSTDTKSTTKWTMVKPNKQIQKRPKTAPKKGKKDSTDAVGAPLVEDVDKNKPKLDEHTLHLDITTNGKNQENDDPTRTRNR